VPAAGGRQVASQVCRHLEQVPAAAGDRQPVGDVALMTAGESLEYLGLVEGGLEQVLRERGPA
jgi:hypothetical protein